MRRTRFDFWAVDMRSAFVWGARIGPRHLDCAHEMCKRSRRLLSSLRATGMAIARGAR